MRLATWLKSLDDQERAFNDAIHETPWDVTTRLVFADWLEENGNSGLSQFHRRMADRLTRTMDDLRTRIRELIDQHMGHGQTDLVEFAIDEGLWHGYFGDEQRRLIAEYIVNEELV